MGFSIVFMQMTKNEFMHDGLEAIKCVLFFAFAPSSVTSSSRFCFRVLNPRRCLSRVQLDPVQTLYLNSGHTHTHTLTHGTRKREW